MVALLVLEGTSAVTTAVMMYSRKTSHVTCDNDLYWLCDLFRD